MEQRNRKQKSSDGAESLSLRRILEIRYLDLVMKKRGLSLENIKTDNLQDGIVYAENYNNDSKKVFIPDKEAYIASQKNNLFKILDIIISDSKEKLHNGNCREYCFNLANLDFIDGLLTSYEEGDRNCFALLDRRYDEIDNYFRKFLHKGLIRLAKNKATNLKIEEVNQEWDLRFNPMLRKMLAMRASIQKIMNSLEEDIDSYVSRINPTKENLLVLENIEHKLKLCSNEIENAITENKLEITASELEDQLYYFAKTCIEKNKRSERAMKGWKTKKGIDKKTE